MIVATDITRRFGERTVLRGASATFAPDAVTALVGPSGGGKSTLLRCINGLERFDTGSIEVYGERVASGTGPRSADERAAIARVRSRVGMVFQQFHLFQHMSALSNVAEAPMRVLGLSRAEATERAAALLDKVGVSHRSAALPREMSGGEQQRVAIARALAMSPRALLLDEPTSALDPERKAEVCDVLIKLAAEGTAMVLVTHEMALVRELAAQVLVLHGGEIIERGAPDEVFDAPSEPRTRAFLGKLRGA